MNYSKPEILVLGDANYVIQGKISDTDVDPPTNLSFASSYDLDE